MEDSARNGIVTLLAFQPNFSNIGSEFERTSILDPCKYPHVIHHGSPESIFFEAYANEIRVSSAQCTQYRTLLGGKQFFTVTKYTRKRGSETRKSVENALCNAFRLHRTAIGQIIQSVWTNCVEVPMAIHSTAATAYDRAGTWYTALG